MKRLTEKGFNYSDAAIVENMRMVTVSAAMNRLAAYEDTGLEPAEIEIANKVIVSAFNLAAKSGTDILIERLKEIIQAEAEGRLVVLPCKTVFEPTWDAGKDCDLVCPVLIDGEGYCDLCEKAALFVRERPCKQDDIDRLGKTAFRTREEAEAKLREVTDRGL